MSDELVTYLRERLDEEECVAKRAAFGWGATWTQEDETDGDGEWAAVHAEGKRDMVGCEDGDVIEHIARWDPSRVHAEVEAKRAVLDRLEAVRREDAAGWNDYSEWIQGARGPELVRATDPKERDGLELAVRLLASPYADRADFRDEWRETP